VARTNSNGLAMLPNMVAYQQNKISIKAEEIPFDMQVNETSRLVTPFARSGVFIQLDIKRSNNRLVRILKVDGSPVPIGSKVHLLPRNTNFLVARRGQVYLTELSTNNTLQVSFQENTCSADLSAPVNSADTHKILIVVCK
jgi:outer membrane usher protein